MFSQAQRPAGKQDLAMADTFCHSDPLLDVPRQLQLLPRQAKLDSPSAWQSSNYISIFTFFRRPRMRLVPQAAATTGEQAGNNPIGDVFRKVRHTAFQCVKCVGQL